MKQLVIVGALLLATSAHALTCGGVDDTATLQAAVDGAGNAPVRLPDGGTCHLTGTLVIQDSFFLELTGNALLTWGGPPDQDMVLLRDVREAKLHGFRVQVSTAAPVRDVFRIENGAGSTVTPSKNVIERVFVECVNGGCQYGVRIALGAGGDNNNDFNRLSGVAIKNPARGCVSIDHKQSKSNVFEDLDCSNNSRGENIVRTAGGSFNCIRCAGGYSTGADFYLGDSTDAILIQSGNFEGSAALLDTGGPSGASFAVTVATTRWTANNLRADNRMIKFQFRGPLTLQGNYIRSTGRALEVHFNPGGGIGSFVSLGNAYESTLTNPYTGVQPCLSQGNTINRGAGVVLLP